MSRAQILALLALALAVLVLVGVIEDPTMETCPESIVDGDAAMWAEHPSLGEEFQRDTLANFYDFPAHDWDQGWGWDEVVSADGHQEPLGKMMSAGYLLLMGVDPTPVVQGEWAAQSQRGALVQAARRGKDCIDIVYRGPTGALMYYSIAKDPWHPGEAGQAGPEIDVSASVGEVKKEGVPEEKEEFLIEGTPRILEGPLGQPVVFARGQRRNLLYFRRAVDGSWSVTDVTMAVARDTPIGDVDRYFFGRDFAVERGHLYDFELFLTDDFDHLIHFGFFGSGIWGEDVTEQVGSRFRITNPEVSVTALSQDVVGLDSNGALLHFRSTEERVWTAIDLSAETDTTRPVQGRPALLRRGGYDEMLIVAARSSEHLLLFEKFDFLAPWFALDLTELALPGHVIAGDPVLTEGDPSFHVFATDINAQLLHIQLLQSGLHAENLSETAYGSPVTVGSRPVVSQDGPLRIDLFARNQFASLVHFYLADGTWRAENVSLAGSSSFSPPNVAGDPVVVRRRPDALDVFIPYGVANDTGESIFGDFTIHPHHYAAAGNSIPWHGPDEYSHWAAGNFEYEPRNDDDGDYANAHAGIWDDRVAMHCPSFEAAGGGVGLPIPMTPALRGGVMLHEATHMRMGGKDRHPRWDEHGLGATSGRLGNRDNHGPYQVKIEYLCDIEEFHRDDVPLDAYEGSVGTAISLMDHIGDPPDWTCGVPRPL